MRSQLLFVFAVLCCISGSIGRRGFGPGEQEWDYVEVRPNAKMFWWLYYTTADVDSYDEKPLIIWLQGGPGISSTGYGNFMELGPLDLNLNDRSHTWVKEYNVLFIDNPVGTGFSHVTDSSAFAKTNTQIAQDLLKCMQAFYQQLPKFSKVPTYIATESYGGKMGAEFAYIWAVEQKAGKMNSNLKGISFGDAWISPIDFITTWAPFLLNTGMVDTEGAKAIEAAAKMTEDRVKAGDWAMATQMWAYTTSVVQQKTHNIDFFNILEKIQKHSSPYYELSPQNATQLDAGTVYRSFATIPYAKINLLMNGLVKDTLGLSSMHGIQSSTVFDELREDFMKPVINQVETLLRLTDLKVVIYSGQLDLTCDTPGTVKWVESMSWKDATSWKNAVRNPIMADDIIEGFVKGNDRLKMYWVNRAGHMVPIDNPKAMNVILENLTS